MKQITLVILSFLISLTVLAQDQNKVTTLIKEGIALHDGAKYQDAIAKYKEALQLDPDNAQANYEIAFTLFNTNAGKEAIPYLNKIVAGKSAIVAIKVNAVNCL